MRVAGARYGVLMGALMLLSLLPATPASADDSMRWVLQNGIGQLADRFGSSDMVMATGVPAREGGELFPTSDVFVVADTNWEGRDSARLHDVSNPDGIPNTVFGFEVIQHPIYLPYMRVGRYDVVIDNDQDGTYTEGIDEVLGFDDRPAFRVFYDGNARGIDKQRLKEEFARPFLEAALEASKYGAIAGVAEIVDLGGPARSVLTIGASTYELSETAASAATQAHHLTQVNEATGELAISTVTGQSGGLSWAAGQVKAAAGSLHDAARGIYADPPDPQYTQVAAPDPKADRFPEQTPNSLYNAFARVSNLSILAAGDANAVLHAMEKMDGAAQDNAVPFIKLQAEALRDYAGALETRLRDLEQRSDELAAELRAQGLGGLSEAQLARLTTLQERLASEGFSPAELARFAAAGVPDTAVEQLRQELLRTPAAQLTGTFADRFDAVAQVIRDGRAGLRDAAVQAANVAEAVTPNTPPALTDDELDVVAGDTGTVEVLANDTDADGDAFTLVGIGDPAQGDVTCTSAGRCTYTADRGGGGTDWFTYTVADARGAEASGSVRVTITPKNFPPEAKPDSIVTRRGGTRSVNVLTNDTDPNGDGLRVTATGTPGHGTAACTESGDCTYTAAAGHAGTDTFTYVVEDPSGAKDTGTVNVEISAANGPPVAAITGQAETPQDQLTSFDAGASTDPDGDIVEYRWDFGDGSDPQTGSAAWVSHAFGRPGTFTVTVRVTDDGGATAEAQATITVTNVAPYMQAGPYPRAPVGVTRAYDVFVGTGATEPTDVRVDFGDGSAVAERRITTTGTSAFNHAYAAPGTYPITATATDAAGEMVSSSTTVVVADAHADAGPDQTADEGAPVTFANDSTEPDVHTSVTWDFGDGTLESSERAPTHPYRQNGTYTARVTVKDDGAEVTDTARITVRNVAPRAQIASTLGGDNGRQLSVRAVATDPGPDDALSYRWDFGDGQTADGRTAEHTYASNGPRRVRLVVTDSDGATTTVERDLVVGPSTGGARDSRGTDFWLAFPRNYSEPPALTLFLAGEAATTGRVEVPGIGFSEPFDVEPGKVTSVRLPADAQISGDTPVIEDRGIHVTAASEVSVYGLNRIQYTTDAYLGLPVDALGNRYRLASYTGAFGAGPQGTIVATANDTKVTITPTHDLADGRPAEPFDITLDVGETYTFTSAVDVTGSLVEADHPISVFGAHRCANVPVNVVACDHLIEQLPPTSAWGREFVSVPLATRSKGDTFRIVADRPATEVKVNDTVVATLGAGEFHEQIIEGAARITTSEPALVMQYSNGSGFDTTVSDPFMVLIPPLEQLQPAYTVTTPPDGFATHFLNLVVPTAGRDAVRVDGEPLPEGTLAMLDGADVAVGSLPIAAGDHRITGATPLGATMYGFADYDSYGYGGGFGIAQVATVARLELTPADETVPVKTRSCVRARALTARGAVVPDVRVDFTIAGTHDQAGFATTGDDGDAEYCYRGDRGGDDTITAAVGVITGTASKRWRTAPAPPAPLVPTPQEPVAEPAPVVATADPPAPSAPVPPAQTGADLLLACSERPVVLEDLVPQRGGVQLLGVTDRRFAGQQATIVFVPTGKTVATAKVGADGRFAARAPLPAAKYQSSGEARYEARIGRERSLKLKLTRRMQVTSLRATGGRVTIQGQVAKPLAPKRADRAIVIERRLTCAKSELVARVMPRADGSFTATVPAPSGQGAAVYRLRTRVARSARDPRLERTFTLPRSVDL